jgi:hypothetical protein
MGWFAVRSIYRFGAQDDRRPTYEERVVLFEAATADVAIARAEVEAVAYAEVLGDCEPTGLFQSYWLFDEPGDGAEVFSLMRSSELEPDDYLDSFFDTGDERVK